MVTDTASGMAQSPRTTHCHQQKWGDRRPVPETSEIQPFLRDVKYAPFSWGLACEIGMFCIRGVKMNGSGGPNGGLGQDFLFQQPFISRCRKNLILKNLVLEDSRKGLMAKAPTID